jgi:obg-like ATPase 1
VASVDGLYHLVRAFDNDDVTHVENTVDPIRDLGIIQDELRLKDEESVERQLGEWERLASKPASANNLVPNGRHTIKEHAQGIEQVADFLASGTRDVRKGQWDAHQAHIINSLHLLTAKPMVYLCNISMDDYLSGVTKDHQW